MKTRPVTVDSSMINTVAFVAHQNEDGTIDHRMRVMFNSGEVYDYEAVPISIYNRVISASSVGKSFNSLVKNAGYTFTKFG